MPNGSLVDSQYEIAFRHAQERIRRQIYRTREEAKADIFDYIEVFYNRKRQHAYLDYVSPVEFEKRAVGLNWVVRILGARPMCHERTLLEFRFSSAPLHTRLEADRKRSEHVVAFHAILSVKFVEPLENKGCVPAKSLR